MEIAGYNCLKEISRGPVTSVYLCRLRKKDGVVLLKILHPQYSGDHEISKRFSREANFYKKLSHPNIVSKRFSREANFYKKLSHPNIVSVLDLGKTDHQYYIVMEYVSGWPLDKYIKLFHPVSANISIAIMYQILSGLQYAHTQGVIHRDIKPSNILFGESGVVKISDFGLARQIDISAITEQGNIIGTPAYMAPEVLRGEESTYKSDIFSLGVTWYELLTGKNPFRGDSIPESINNILNNSAPHASAMGENIPEWLDGLISGMLKKNPDERSENCGTLIAQISVQNKHAGFEKFAQELVQNIEEKKIAPVYHISQSSAKRGRKIWLTPLLILFGILIIISIVIFFVDENVSQTENLEESAISIPETQTVPALVPSDTLIAEPENKMILSDEMDTFSVVNERSEDLTVKNEEIPEELPPGGIYVNVVPWADIYIDGNHYGTTPFSEDIMLEPGIYQLELSNPAFETTSSSIKITSNVVDTLKFRLHEVFGHLNIKVKPWGKVYINEEYIDTTPMKEPVKLKRGRYHLLVRNPYFSDYSESIEIVAGQTHELSINMTK
jgi:serine/threonine-protein kinase